jgi:hypothetical protein
MSTEPGPQNKPSPPLRCLSCDQEEASEQHKANCQGIATEHPNQQHPQANAMPANEDSSDHARPSAPQIGIDAHRLAVLKLKAQVVALETVRAAYEETGNLEQSMTIARDTTLVLDEYRSRYGLPLLSSSQRMLTATDRKNKSSDAGKPGGGGDVEEPQHG